MQLQIEDLSPVEKKLAVEIPWEQVREKLDKAYRALSSQVTMNGFRKGKVPRAVLEKKYGKAVQNEVAKELVQESFIRAATEQKLEPVAEPHIDEIVMKPGEAFRYSARIEVRAPIELKEYEGLPGTRVKVVVTDEEVERALQRKRSQHTEYEPISDRTETAATDALIVELKGTVGELPVDRPELQVDLTDARTEPLPGLAAALVGLPLDAKDHALTLEIPADHEHKEIAGKTANLTVTIRDARKKVVPDLDDEFAKDTGEADSLDELRGKLRQALEKAAGSRAERDTKDGLLKELIKRNPTHVAASLVERGIDSQIERARMTLAMQGVDITKTGVDLSSMRDRIREGAADEIRGQLLLEAVADKESLEITDEEIDAKVAELAAQQNKRPAKLKADMQKEGSLESLRWRLRQEKALDLLSSRATISEIDAPDPSVETAGAETKGPESRSEET
jgi:trigger factor